MGWLVGTMLLTLAETVRALIGGAHWHFYDLEGGSLGSSVTKMLVAFDVLICLQTQKGG